MMIWRRIHRGLSSRVRGAERERGSIAVVAAVVLLVLFGFGALVVDGGYLAMRRRSLQAIADAAVLAGVVDLPTSATAIASARSMATKNGYTNGTNGVTVTVNSPYSSDSQRIEVIVSMNVNTFLGRALKINSGFIKGRAVATLPSPSPAIFAGGTTCSGGACGLAMCVQGQNFHVTGDVHSNGSIQVSGDSSDSISGAVEYRSGCAGSNGGPIPVGSGPTATASEAFPLSWTASDFPCTYSAANFDVSQPGAWWQTGTGVTGAQGNSTNHAKLLPGVYCSTSGQLQLNGQYVDGTGVTFVALTGAVQMSGQNMSFTAYTKNTLIYMPQANTNTLQLGSTNWTWTGDIFAPGSLINISGQGFTTSGSIIGNNVALSTGGAGWTMTGGGGSSLPYLSE
jgi:Putative Flp pilus-assembly TadE/G-like